MLIELLLEPFFMCIEFLVGLLPRLPTNVQVGFRYSV